MISSRLSRERIRSPGADPHHELLGLEGFVDEVVGAGVHAVDDVLRSVPRREQNDVDVAAGGAPPDLLAEFDAGHFRHLPVGDHHAELPAADQFQGLAAVAGHGHLVPELRQRMFQDFHRDVVVIRDQNSHEPVSEAIAVRKVSAGAVPGGVGWPPAGASRGNRHTAATARAGSAGARDVRHPAGTTQVFNLCRRLLQTRGRDVGRVSLDAMRNQGDLRGIPEFQDALQLGQFSRQTLLEFVQHPLDEVQVPHATIA